MRRIVAAILSMAWANVAQQVAAGAPQSSPANPPPSASAPQQSTITVPVGTKVALTLTSPLWAKSVKPGDSIYLATSFPVAVENRMAIPPGTYVEGKIDALTRPSFFSPHALFQLHFTKLIFANGYTVPLPEFIKSAGAASQVGNASAPALQAFKETTPGLPPDMEAAVARVYVEVTYRNDVLLDNGAPVEMLLQSPLTLDANAVAAAVSRSKPLLFGPTKSSSRCVPTPGTPGTPGTSDTVVPGSPGTPPTVIPGAPGTPDIVIPGTPATPPTIIPGTPGTAGTPGTTCPGPLSPGKYQFRWRGIGPTAQVEVILDKKQIAQVQARVVILGSKPSSDEIYSRNNPDGSVSLASLQFAGEDFALFFD